MKLFYNRILCLIFLLLTIGVGVNASVDVTYVGTIADNLFAPTAVYVDAEQIAILEPFSKRITVFTVDGQLQQTINIDGNALGLIRYDNTEFLFCDRKNRTIVEVDPILKTQRVLLDETSGLKNPVDLVLDNDQLYVLDADLKAIVHFDASLIQVATIPLVNTSGISMKTPMSFVYNRSTNSFYVIDQTNSFIWRMTHSGQFVQSFCSFGSDPNQVTRAGELSVGPTGNIFVTDRYQGRILVFNATGNYVGNVTTQEQLPLNMPTGIAIDNTGVLYVASTEGRNIQIMHVTVTDETTSALATQLAFPNDYDTLAVEQLRFVAYAEQNIAGSAITGFDFEIFTADDTTLPVRTIQNLPPKGTTEQNGNPSALTAEWTPEEQLAYKTGYAWHVRARSAVDVGSWTTMRYFQTSTLPLSFELEQNYPNPFNPETVIGFTLPITSDVELTIYNLLGQKVQTYKSTQQTAGYHEIIWDGHDKQGTSVASGIYFYRLTADDKSETKKMVLVR